MTPDAVAAARDYLRVEGMHEDAAPAALLGSALGLAERFLGSVPIVREVTEMLPASVSWWRLTAAPVRAITDVAEILPDGSARALPVGAYEIDLDGAGGGWVRASAGRLRVTATAGMADGWDGLPEAVRQGAVRLAAHLFAHRDRADDAGQPAAVAALWRPYRRMRLS